MRIVIAGGSGFLGRPLASRLALSGHDVCVLTRGERLGRSGRGLRYVTWQPDGTIPLAARTAPTPDGIRGRTGDWSNELDEVDAIVNLSGAGLADERWTSARKATLLASRTLPTRSLVTALRHTSSRPKVFIQASAIGYYGAHGDEPLDESSPAGSDFLAQLCVAWEREAAQAASSGCRIVFLRTGLALAKDGGLLRRMLPPFQWSVGGRLGSGRQVMSWIHRDDWTSMVTWALETPEVSGPLNATAPKPVTNAEFTRALARAVHRPAWVMVPPFVLRTMVGAELADVAILAGQRVLPRRALG